MKTTKKIIQVGDSSAIIIDAPIMRNMDLQVGDLVEVDLKKIINKHKNRKEE